MTNILSRKVFIGRCLIFLICVEAVVVALVASPWIAGDSPSYLKLAHNLSLGFYGEVEGGRVFADTLRPPGYPILLFLLHKVAGFSLSFIVGIQVFVYLLTLALIDRAIRGNQDLQLAFRLVASIYPFGAAYSAFIMTEAWTMLFFTSSLLLAYHTHNARLLFMSGILCGLSALFRTDLLLTPIAITAVLLIISFTRRNRRLALAALAVPLGAAIVLAPYSIWNYRNFGTAAPVPAAAAFGNSLHTAYWQQKVELGDIFKFYSGEIPIGLKTSGYIDEVHRLNRAIGAPENTPPDNPVYYSPELRVKSTKVIGDAAVQHWRNEPLLFLKHCFNNIGLLWVPTDSTKGYGPAVSILLIASATMVTILGFIGIGVIVFRLDYGNKHSPPLAKLFLPMSIIPFLLPYVAHIPTHLEARYTATLRPMLMAYAAVGLVFLSRKALGALMHRRAGARRAQATGADAL